ncbi:proline-rich family protein [Perilla frutescens var. frutescens]|nr:proline-rich family protein [Perilla frutescens var. frutescens]
MVKTTKGGKIMNPTDAYHKELCKKELKRNKKERKKVREVGILKKDPDTLKDQIQKLESMSCPGCGNGERNSACMVCTDRCKESLCIKSHQDVRTCTPTYRSKQDPACG